jgi:hypothetical protein
VWHPRHLQLDLGDVREAYALLFEPGCLDALAARMHGAFPGVSAGKWRRAVVEAAARGVQGALGRIPLPSARDDWHAAALAVRTLLVLAPCPLLSDPQRYRQVAFLFLQAVDALAPPHRARLAQWLATAGLDDWLDQRRRAHSTRDGAGSAEAAAEAEAEAAVGNLLRAPAAAPAATPAAAASASPALIATEGLSTLVFSVQWCQQFMSIKLYEGDARVDEIAPAARWIALLHAAHDRYVRCVGVRALPASFFYNEVVSEEVNLRDDFRRWLAGRRGVRQPLFSFCSTPCLLDAAAKATILQIDAALQMADNYRSAVFSSLFSTAPPESPFLHLRVRRDRIIEDALAGIVAVEDKAILKRPLRVRFDGEEGQDEGGVKKEFFMLASRRLFTPEFGMFAEESETNCLWFNTSSFESPLQFELVGALVGLAIYNSVILDVNFPLVLYRCLKRETPTLEDVEQWKPSVGRSLRHLLAYAGDDLEDVFCLDFTVTYEAWGKVQTHELIPDGASVPVTRDNRRSYVRKYIHWLVHDSVRTPLKAFLRGFGMVAGGPALDLFRPEELQLLVTGSAALDFDAFERAAKYEEPYDAQHWVAKTLWSVVHSLSAEDRRRFLSFCTGTDRAPIRGLGSLQLTVSRAGPDTERLPTAHTCFLHLLIPEYGSQAKLEQKLRAAIRESEGFGLI